MPRSWKSSLRLSLVRHRRRLRGSEATFIVLAAVAGVFAGMLTLIQQFIAHGLQQLLYGVTINRLSALGSIHHPWRLLALPTGGLLLVLMARVLRRRRAPVDVVEANAMHGGRVPLSDTLTIAAQTILSNGTGASVGLEAAYAQVGGGVASLLGGWLKLRRGDLRTLVGAGAGAAVGAAFGAPLTGAFYAFEIVIGTYTPSAVAPVLAAALGAVSVTRALGTTPYLIATTSGRSFTFVDYLAYAALGLICALVGILIMRLVTFAEQRLQRWKQVSGWGPIVGGFLLIPLALASPQTLSAGHGALHLNLLIHPALSFLLIVLVLKIAASVVSLSFGFRGGLFFASLFLGALIGEIFAATLGSGSLGVRLDAGDAALVGMAALSVSIVGGPMTLAMLMLETTHDFALMGVVLAATLVSSAFTRETFGYSFSTWRLHVRGSQVRSPRDIGWMLTLTAARIMRRDWTSLDPGTSIAELRDRVPLGSVSKTVLTDGDGRYQGIVVVANAHAADLDPTAPISTIAQQLAVTLRPETSIDAILRLFDDAAADELAVVDDEGHIRGVVTEKHARRRYFEALEVQQRELFGEV